MSLWVRLADGTVDRYREDRQVGSMSVGHTEYVAERDGDDLIIRKFRSSELMESAPQLLQDVKERFEQDSRSDKIAARYLAGHWVSYLSS